MPGHTKTAGRLTGPSFAMGSMFSSQLGATIAVPLMVAHGSFGISAMRLVFAACFSLALVRPNFAGFTARQWRGAIALGVVMAFMTMCFFTAVAKIPVGPAITIDFLGPLSILRPGLFLPPLMFSEDEVEAVMLGLRYVDQRGDDLLQAAASVALAKISAVLSPQAQAQLTIPLSLPGPPRSFPQDTVPLDELRTAIRGRVRLDIGYGDGHERRTERIVWPIQLGFTDQARVLFAWCELRRDFRTFRTDRIVAMTRLDRYPAQRAGLVRRLRTHLDRLANLKISPDGN